jgi:hypothetical protein
VGEVDNFHDRISFPLPSVPICSVSNRVLAGYQLQILLLNDDNANIIGVTFRVIDNHGNPAGKGTIMLADTAINIIAPITTCTMNIVGEEGGSIAHFATGAGEILYAASTLMTAKPQWPGCVSEQAFTVELSNSTYGPISPLASNLFTQTFGVS